MNPDPIRQNQIQQAQNNPGILSPLVGAPKAFPSVMQAQQQIQAATQPIAQAGQAAVTPIGANVEDQLKQLFTLDQQMEQGYSPLPQVPGYVENPADLYRGAGAFAQGTSGNVGAATNVISNITQ